MKKERIYLFLLCVAAVFLFYFSNANFRGYLRLESNQPHFDSHVLDSLDYYEITTRPPYKYRLAFSSIVNTSFNAAYEDSNDVQGFYQVYKGWSLVFFVTSVLSMFYLLRVLGFKEKLSFLGALIFLLLPPMLLAFTLPVHTREDTLAYTLFFWGLIFLVREKRIYFFIVCLLGALTRETLLLLPLLYLFYARDENIIRRLAIAGIPVLVVIALRLIIGMEKYNVWEGLKWNLHNPEQVIGFLLITFNFCWIPYMIHLIYYRSSLTSSAASPSLHFFYRTSIFSLLVILMTTFIGGIYNEIRLLYLFAPWAIIIFLDFVRGNVTLLKKALTRKAFWIYSAIVFAVCSTLVYAIILNWQRFIIPGKFRVPYELWIVISMGYLFLVLLFIPVSVRFFNLRKSYK